jgi:hypothetical protein
MIKLSELDTSRIERAWELLNKRLYLIYRGQSARSFGQLKVSRRSMIEVAGRMTGRDGTS